VEDKTLEEILKRKPVSLRWLFCLPVSAGTWDWTRRLFPVVFFHRFLSPATMCA